MHLRFLPWLLLTPSLAVAGCSSQPDDGSEAPENTAQGGARNEGGSQSGGSSAQGGESSEGGGGSMVPESCSADSFPLAPPEVVAARLSRFLWQEETPDQGLEDAAAAARSPEAVSELALDMLDDTRARAGVAAFVSSWLRLGDLPTLSKEDVDLPQELVASMQKEAPAFGTNVILDGDGRYETLMTASYTFMDETLARHYGISGVTGDELRQVPFEQSERIGILMGAGVLTRFSGALDPPWAPRRFWLTYETLLCDKDAIPVALDSVPRMGTYPTIRDELEAITAPDKGDCHLCHESVNPVGFAFSAFDTLGRFDPLDEVGMPVVTAGTIPAGLAWDQELEVADAADMIRQLIEDPKVGRCFAARWLDYALKPDPRPEDSDVVKLGSELQCSLSLAHSAFEAADGDVRVLVAAIAGTPAFLSP